MGLTNDGVFERYYAPHLFAGRRTTRDRQLLIERVLERIMLELAMNRFEWKGLPETVSPRWLEMSLATRGLAVFFFDDDITNNYISLQGSGYGYLNPQGDYTQFQVWGNGMAFFNKTLDAKDVVPIWSNYLRTPDTDIIDLYAPRIAMMDRTIEINTMSARRTKVIPVTENQKLSVDNIITQINEGNPVIKLTATAAALLANMDALDLGVDPDSLINLQMARSREWAEALTLLGINNANQDKKERLVAAEVSGNDDEIEQLRRMPLQSRQYAAEQINKRWNLNVTVDFKTEVATAELKDTKTPQDAAEKDGDE